MTVSIGDVPGRIFMSYRREETAYPAGWLFDRLVSHFGRDQVFKDVDSIELGDDFAEVITTAVESCEVLLALIGNRWLTATGRDGRRRLDDPNDFVRVEIEVALTRDVRVIPSPGGRGPDAPRRRVARKPGHAGAAARHWSSARAGSISIPNGCSMCWIGPSPGARMRMHPGRTYRQRIGVRAIPYRTAAPRRMFPHGTSSH